MSNADPNAGPAPGATAEATGRRPTLAELGEHEVLGRLHRFCGAVVGDDGAVQSLPPGEQLVVTTDVLVDGVHFCDRTLPPHSLGWRAAAVNLSDLAAMGATPLGLTIGLTLPANTSWPWLEAVYQGLTDCLGQYGGAILGGDLCRGDHRSLAITALGSVKPHQALYRHRAQPGQTLVATGVHGASRAGLALLLGELDSELYGELDSERQGEQQDEQQGVSDSIIPPLIPNHQTWITAHQRPIPQFEAISTLRGLDTQPEISPACMDTSDGLADAVIQICHQSQVGATLLRSQLPIPAGLIDAVGLITAEQWTLYGGEDFELVLSLSPAMAEAFVPQHPGSRIIGHTTRELKICLVDDVTQGPDRPLEQGQGYQHFGE